MSPKKILTYLFVSVYTSGWWALAMFWDTDKFHLLFPVLIVFFGTVYIILMFADWCYKNWNNNE
jgi:hypothetical protein